MKPVSGPLIKKIAVLTLLFVLSGLILNQVAKSATNISATDRWAWNDISGWWDLYITNTVEVQNSKMTGYASSSLNEISFDCATTPIGNICGTSNYRVCNGNSSGVTCNNDASGNLSGCAWNDNFGWTSFWCGDYDCQGGNICSTADYRVTIDSSGDFHGYAWNDATGWTSFNCAEPSLCGSSNYKVNTSWSAGATTGTLESAIFDTQTQGILNNVLWQGAQPAGTCVKFQIAVATSSGGPWNYYGPGMISSVYFGGSCPGPNQTIKISGTDRSWVNNKRYLRYKVTLESDEAGSQTPTVEDIILNWSY